MRRLAVGLCVVATVGCGDDVPTDGTATTSTGADAQTGPPPTSAGASTTAAASSGGTSTAGTAAPTAGSDATTRGPTSTSSGPGPGTSTGTGTSTSGSTSGSGSSGAETGEALVSACVDVDLGAVITTVNGDTTPLADDHTPDCPAGLGGQDAGHAFTAPVDGFYAFDTAGTGFDTVVYATSPGCGDPSIGCNDDAALGVATSRLRVFLAAGQSAVVVVDGWDAGQLGPYTLDTDAIIEPCVDEDLGMVGTTVAAGTTLGELDKLDAPCIAPSGPDRIVRWVAPDDGSWVVSTTGTAFDTVLYAYLGECAGIPIACNDDEMPGILTSRIVVAPGLGNAITVVVDGYGGEAGDYTLSFAPL